MTSTWPRMAGMARDWIPVGWVTDWEVRAAIRGGERPREAKDLETKKGERGGV